MKRLMTLFLFALSISVSAEVIQVPGPNDETITGYWASPSSKAVLILLPGGDGVAWVKNMDPIRPKWISGNLHDLSATGNGVDVVIMDSQYSLGWKGGYIQPRYEKEHLDRIESVVKFYQNKLHKPIFLMGHSNSTISVAEFINRSSANQKMIKGAILSGARNETEFKSPMDVSVLVLHHENDDNYRWTAYEHSLKMFDDIKKIDSKPVQFGTVRGGVSGSNPSTSGHHMYEGALDEASNIVYKFIVTN